MKNKKVLWIIVTIAIILGSILAIIGLTTGTKRGIYFDNTGLHIIGKEIKEEKKFNLEEIEQIDIDVEDFVILFEKSDSYGIEIKSLEGSNDIEWNIQNGTLKINEKDKIKFRIFSFDFSFLDKNNYSYIKIFLPEKAELETLNMQIKNTDLKISNLKADGITIENKYGKVELENIEVTNLKIEMENGDFYTKNMMAEQIKFNNKYGAGNFKDSNSKEINMQIENGDIRLNNLQVKDLIIDCRYGEIQGNELNSVNSDIKNKNGDIKLQGDFTGNTEIDATYGTVKLELEKEKLFYEMDLRSTYGNITLEDQKLKDSTYRFNQGKGKALKVVTNSGNIKIDFNK